MEAIYCEIKDIDFILESKVLYRYRKHNIERRNTMLDQDDPIIGLLIKKIEKFKLLKYNWDSYNADPIDVEVISLAKNILRLFFLQNVKISFVSPMRDGGVQLDISTTKNEIEIEINANKTFSFLLFDKEDNFISEDKYNNLVELISKVKSIV